MYDSENTQPRSPRSPRVKESKTDIRYQRSPSPVPMSPSRPPAMRYEKSKNSPQRPDRPESLGLEELIPEYFIYDYLCRKEQIETMKKQLQDDEVRLKKYAETEFKKKQLSLCMDNVEDFEIPGLLDYWKGKGFEREDYLGQMGRLREEIRVLTGIPFIHTSYQREEDEINSSYEEYGDIEYPGSARLQRRESDRGCPELEADSTSASLDVESLNSSPPVTPVDLYPPHPDALRNSVVPDLSQPCSEAHAELHENLASQTHKQWYSCESTNSATSRGRPLPTSSFRTIAKERDRACSAPGLRDASRERHFNRHIRNEDVKAVSTADITWGHVGTVGYFPKVGSPLSPGRQQGTASPQRIRTDSPRRYEETTRGPARSSSRDGHIAPSSPSSPRWRVPYRTASPLSSMTNSPQDSVDSHRPPLSIHAPAAKPSSSQYSQSSPSLAHLRDGHGRLHHAVTERNLQIPPGPPRVQSTMRNWRAKRSDSEDSIENG
ncbi:hypothetical protein P280DRAFT_303072 [Massarina eburnea CBS 473.64]|uniref:Uncharacterized protein n=1 Tax=Massarina eburnea CBS 473.64 TaxID=1395130 RepID=A0A6A6S1A8_9PLEO|nr:hypothetical protein P280DRAFT_303072 [Massarina eburnea CBS 473.64]